jgi:hypothetical protein
MSAGRAPRLPRELRRQAGDRSGEPMPEKRERSSHMRAQANPHAASQCKHAPVSCDIAYSRSPTASRASARDG